MGRRRQSKRKAEDVNELIKISKTREYLLLITRMKYNEEETLGYCFRFTEVDNKRGNIDPNEFKPNSTKHVLFDVLRLNYIRTILVTKKTGKRNLIDTGILQGNSITENNNSTEKNVIIKKEKSKKCIL